MFVIAEFENANDILVLLEDAIELAQLAAISRHRYISVNIQPDRNRLRTSNGLQQFCEKSIGNRKIIFGDVVLGYLHNNDARIRYFWSCSPSEKFVIRQKFGRLKQSKFARTGDKHEHADPKYKGRHRWIAKCLSEPHY